MTVIEKNILKFITSLQEWERGYIVSTIQLSDNFRTYFRESGKSEEEFCLKMKIHPKHFNSFINGGYNYNLSQISTLEHLWTELKRSKVKVDVVTVINHEKESSGE